ncbi:MAG: STAS-like domain-containing protein [Hyphomicrobiales bacterium]|nr:STAS-like domain-containing protein [Hyphomicrobiales bacterium]
MINIADDFSKTPAGRVRSDGPSSGERFREDFLLPQLKTTKIVEIKLDGAAGYPSSFLEEAFGGLIREGYLTSSEAKSRIRIIASAPEFKRYEKAIWYHIDQANQTPKARKH